MAMVSGKVDGGALHEATVPEKVLLQELKSEQERVSNPRQRCQKKCLIRADHTSVGRPQEEGMMSVAASFPSEKTKVTEPVGLGPTPAHNTTKKLCPNITVRLSISSAC